MSVAASLFAERTRADVVAALLDGRALTAGELARAAGVSAPTISSHLKRLADAGLVNVEAQGRHRYYRLRDERVGHAFEALAALAPVRPPRSYRQSRIAAQLRLARTCYDHLAGAVAVNLADSLTRRGVLIADGVSTDAAPNNRSSPTSGWTSTALAAAAARSPTPAWTGANDVTTSPAPSAQPCYQA